MYYTSWFGLFGWGRFFGWFVLFKLTDSLQQNLPFPPQDVDLEFQGQPLMLVEFSVVLLNDFELAVERGPCVLATIWFQRPQRLKNQEPKSLN